MHSSDLRGLVRERVSNRRSEVPVPEKGSGTDRRPGQVWNVHKEVQNRGSPSTVLLVLGRRRTLVRELCTGTSGKVVLHLRQREVKPRSERNTGRNW